MREKFEAKIGRGKEKEAGEPENLETKEISPRERKREALYEKIEQKVGIIKEIRGLSEEWANLDVEKIKKACEEKMENIKSYYPPEALEKDSKLGLLKKEELDGRLEGKKILDRIDLLEDKKEKGEVIDENGLKRLQKKSDELLDQRYEIYEKIALLEKDDDVLFLSRIQNFFDNLIEKRGQTIQAQEDYKKDPTAFIKTLRQKTGYNLESIKDKSEIESRFSGYSVSIILAPEDFRRIIQCPPTVSGTHITKTIFNIIKNQPGKEETIVHENNHNLSESFVKKAMPLNWLKKRLADRLGRLERFKMMEGPSEMIKLEENLAKKGIEEYIFETFDEVIADIDSMAEGKITTFLTRFKKATGIVYQFGESLENKEIKEIVFSAYEKMQDRFVNFISELSTSFFVAKKTNKIDDIKAAVILFKPQQIRSKLPKFTRHLVGQEDYEIYSALETLLTGGRFIKYITSSEKELKLIAAVFGKELPQAEIDLARKLKEKKSIPHFFGLNNLKKLNDLLQKSNIEINITTEDLNEANNSLNIRSSLIFNVNKELLGLENFSQVIDYIRNIAERLGLPQLNDFGEKRLAPRFCFFQLKEAVKKNDFQKLDAIHKKWKGNEVLSQSFVRAIQLFLETHRIKNKSPFWQWLKEKGLDKKTKI